VCVGDDTVASRSEVKPNFNLWAELPSKRIQQRKKMGLQAQPETPKERSHDSEHGKNGYRWFQSANKAAKRLRHAEGTAWNKKFNALTPASSVGF
jgi:hypothetical protein